MIEIVNKLLATGTLLSHIFLILVLAYLFLKKENNLAKKFLGQYGLLLAWLVALFSALLSLYYSEIVGYLPCSLCWWQRVFIYPQAIFLGIAYFTKEFKHSYLYALILTILGAVVGVYQNLLYYVGTENSIACDTTISCTKLYVLEFGYITIPMMSLTAFILMIFFLKMQKK